MALVFGIVVADELLFGSGDAIATHINPVAVLYLCGVACAFLLFLHLYVELLLVNGEAVLTTDKLSKVEREAVGVEEFESLYAVKFLASLALKFFHRIVYHANTLVEGTKEGVFLLLDDACDELALCGKLGVCFAHLVNEHGDKFVKECLFLVEEGVGITYGTTQDATYYVACLSISWQLTVGNREGYGADVVGNDAHGNVGVFLVAVFLAAEALYLVNHRLEHVGVVV